MRLMFCLIYVLENLKPWDFLEYSCRWNLKDILRILFLSVIIFFLYIINIAEALITAIKSDIAYADSKLESSAFDQFRKHSFFNSTDNENGATTTGSNLWNFWHILEKDYFNVAVNPYNCLARSRYSFLLSLCIFPWMIHASLYTWDVFSTQIDNH